MKFTTSSDPGSGWFRRHLLIMGALILGTATSLSAHAQRFPSRPVHMVVPFAPGGASDQQARALANRLAAMWQQPVVVENRAGAAGAVGASYVAKAAADGYTLFHATHPIFAINPFLYEKLGYELGDFSAIAMLSETPSALLVSARSNIRSVSELVAEAKAKPGSINFASGGLGSSQQLAGELFKTATGINIVHVPYRGTGPAALALIANEVQIQFDAFDSAKARIDSGSARGLAVTSAARQPLMPQLPTMQESGIDGFEVTLAYGLLAPRGTPPEVVSVINRDVNKILQDPGFRREMNERGITLHGGASDKFEKFVVSERRKWEPIVRRLDIKGN